MENISNKKYPNIVDINDPDKTPIFTPSIYWLFSTKAKFPINRLMVKPIPVNTPTPYKLNQLDLFGICAIFNLIAHIENKNTPNCFPKNRPSTIPSGTGKSRELKLTPSKETPALARANKGMIPNAT